MSLFTLFFHVQLDMISIQTSHSFYNSRNPSKILLPHVYSFSDAIIVTEYY